MKQNKVSQRLVALVLAIALVASFLLPAVSPLRVSAGTEVGGQLTADTIWTAANSPYIVTASVLVNSGVTLTIEPGVVVKFRSGKGMQVNGELIARGTSAEPIIFTSNEASPAPGDWVNILFTDTASDAQYDEAGNYLSGSIVQYSIVEYGGGGNSPALKIVSSSPFIDHSTIRNNASSGIYVDQGSPKIANSTLSNNSATLYGGGISISGGTVTLNNNTLSSNSATSGGGIYISGGTVVTLTGNTLSSNSATSGGGIYISGGTVTLNYNTISNNSATSGGGIYISEGTVTLSNNTLSSNSATSGGGIYISEGTVTLTGNTLSNNSANYGGGIYSGGVVTLSYNQISGNTQGSGIYIGSGQPLINHNNIQDNTPYNVHNANPQGASNVNATNNWWGTADETTIQAHIYDWFDDASLGVVDYAPYLTSASQIDTTLPTTPVVSDEGNYTTSTTQLQATWSSADPESGIAEYQFAIGTSPGGTNVVGWTSAGTDTEIIKTGLSLNWGTTYYFAVKAKNTQGLWSEVGVADGIIILPSWLWIALGVVVLLIVGVLLGRRLGRR